MLKNYKKLSDGTIKQIKISPFVYDYNYSNNYNSDIYKLNSKFISYLRFGFLVGVIGRLPNSIVDVGYGNGEFLNVCKTAVKECYGYDVSDYPIPNGVVRVNSITEQFFDVITFFDSLEHFDDISFVKELKCNYICISVPHCHYFSDEWFDGWKHRKPDEHIWHFNRNSLLNFMMDSNYILLNEFNAIEDLIRSPIDDNENILTMIFKKQ